MQTFRRSPSSHLLEFSQMAQMDIVPDSPGRFSAQDAHISTSFPLFYPFHAFNPTVIEALAIQITQIRHLAPLAPLSVSRRPSNHDEWRKR